MGKAQALRSALTGTGDSLLAAVLAPACACCRKPLDAPLTGPVCNRCWQDAQLADGKYEGALRDIIHAYKYEGRPSLTKPLGALLKARSAESLHDAACVVPVPQFLWRRLARGFNPADSLARELGVTVLHALWRVRSTRPQTGLSASERRRNVRGAFRLSPLLSQGNQTRFITNRIVVLCDDVLTTGATSNECADVLTQAGAGEVRVVTLARA